MGGRLRNENIKLMLICCEQIEQKQNTKTQTVYQHPILCLDVRALLLWGSPARTEINVQCEYAAMNFLKYLPESV